MEHPPTIVRLVEQAIRDWILLDADEAPDPETPLAQEPGYSVFYMDETQRDRIQISGLERDRCGIWVEPCDVAPGQNGTRLLVAVKVAYRLNGEPTVTDFQVAMTEDLKVLVH